jgi:hypothetical protein
MLIRSALFWNITRRHVVIGSRRFGTTYRSHLQGSRVREKNNYHTTPRNIPEERRSLAWVCSNIDNILQNWVTDGRSSNSDYFGFIGKTLPKIGNLLRLWHGNRIQSSKVGWSLTTMILQLCSSSLTRLDWTRCVQCDRCTQVADWSAFALHDQIRFDSLRFDSVQLSCRQDDN